MFSQEPVLWLRPLDPVGFSKPTTTVQQVKLVRGFSSSQLPDPVVEGGGEHP